MAISWDSLMYSLNLRYLNAHTEYLSAVTFQEWAKTEHLAGNYELSLWYLISSVKDLLDAYSQTLGYGSWGDYYYLIVEMFNRCDPTTPFTLDMDAILSVMLSANPEQVDYFVGLVDAYRQSIWNRPFNKNFYAALARGFMIWP